MLNPPFSNSLAPLRFGRLPLFGAGLLLLLLFGGTTSGAPADGAYSLSGIKQDALVSLNMALFVQERV